MIGQRRAPASAPQYRHAHDRLLALEFLDAKKYETKAYRNNCQPSRFFGKFPVFVEIRSGRAIRAGESPYLISP
jgi:hypothetical protein